MNTVLCHSKEDALAISNQLTQRHFVHHTAITFEEPMDYQALKCAATLADVKFYFKGSSCSTVGIPPFNSLGW